MECSYLKMNLGLKRKKRAIKEKRGVSLKTSQGKLGKRRKNKIN